MRDDVTIRAISGDDEICACADIMASTDPWLRYGRTREILRATLTTPGVEVYIAVDAPSARVVGLVALALKIPLIRGYILGLAVASDFRNRGIGTRLLQFAEERIFRESPNVFMCVTSFNHGARRLYERLGYKQIGLITDYAIAGVDEHLLRKTRGPTNTYKP